ncbi:MAG: pyruvate kinase [Candidatus Omnitrophica bacterium]|nr:pyruvate kinase [Candidatus Omnitrophota bacterium]
MTKTKIICTLGPASSDETVLRKMILAGMDVARLNFSHGEPKELARKINVIRRINTKYRRRIKFLGDLQGHRIRVGNLAGGTMELKKGWMVWLTQKNIKGADRRIPFDYRGPLRDIKGGQYIFIDDGNIALEVKRHAGGDLETKVAVGGTLKEHKGINIPEARLNFGSISRKDVEDILFCEKRGLEYIAQSFVRTRSDMLAVQDVLGKKSKCRIIAKIENREGIKNIDEIIAVSDGIMIARGDMGVSLPIYEVPIIQKMIIRKCNRAGKFVITATQMLESMTDNRIPTRAEVTDVANAIIDGTDFVMLSAESAVGKYPVETVRMMNSVIKFTEGYLNELVRSI